MEASSGTKDRSEASSLVPTKSVSRSRMVVLPCESPKVKPGGLRCAVAMSWTLLMTVSVILARVAVFLCTRRSVLRSNRYIPPWALPLGRRYMASTALGLIVLSLSSSCPST